MNHINNSGDLREENINNTEDYVMDEADSHQKKMELLDKMMDEITFSDDEDEENNKGKFILDKNNYQEEMSKIDKLYEQNQEEGVDEGVGTTS